MSEPNIAAALAALSNSAQGKITELRGEPGPRGERGLTGLSGRDAKDVNLVIGKVITGDTAEARVRREGDNFILDLQLPRAEQGERGVQGLPGPIGPRGERGEQGERGFRGEKGYAEKGEAGPAGKPGKDSTIPGPVGLRGSQGPQGEKGETGMTREEIANLVVSILSDAGVLSIESQKLVAVRAKLKSAINEADSRHQFQVSELVRSVDKLF